MWPVKLDALVVSRRAGQPKQTISSALSVARAQYVDTESFEDDFKAYGLVDKRMPLPLLAERLGKACARLQSVREALATVRDDEECADVHNAVAVLISTGVGCHSTTNTTNTTANTTADDDADRPARRGPPPDRHASGKSPIAAYLRTGLFRGSLSGLLGIDLFDIF